MTIDRCTIRGLMNELKDKVEEAEHDLDNWSDADARTLYKRLGELNEWVGKKNDKYFDRYCKQFEES